MRIQKSILTIVLLFCIMYVQAQPRVRLWQHSHVRSKSVTLTPYIPKHNMHDGMAIIICPGGSYCWHASETEGEMMAEWLQKEGIAAFVLNYRVQGIFPYIFHTRSLFGGHKHPDMIEDLQRAIQYVREHKDQYGINPDRLGTMGFSAGGHLAMSSACYSHTNFLAAHDIKTEVSLRPNFVASIYPVISMSHPDTHKRSRRALLGERGKRRKIMQDSLSLEHHIPTDCPPVFLLNCKDDPIVRYHNSELLDSSLTVHNINHRYLQYSTGGHGFGANENKGSEETKRWKHVFLDWLNTLKL